MDDDRLAFAADAWQPGAYVKATETLGSALFGIDVALDDSGETLAVGARGEAGDNGDRIGCAYLY